MCKVYGIDLGTTNSIIGRDDALLTGLVSSSVDIVKAEQVSRDVYGKDIVSSYKVNMSTGESGKVPVYCSSIILKKLASVVAARTDEECRDVCISVPAYFATTQREAVKAAAEKAGLNLRRVINEPTAAAIYVCRDIKDYVIVYDLGGGTFDVTLIDARDGSYRTIATSGEILGGDDLDTAMLLYVLKKNKIRVRYQTKENKAKLRTEIRLVKERLQKERCDQVFSLEFMGGSGNCVFTVDEYKQLVEEVFTPTIIKTQALIDAYVQSYESPKIIYTGGSTYCPYLMEWLHEVFDLEEIEYNVPKDMLVAYGIAYVAKLVEDGEDTELITNVTKQLSVELDDGTMFPIIEENTIIPCTVRYPFFNMWDSDTITVRLYQGNSRLAKDNDFIGTLDYKFDKVMKAGTGLINVDIVVTYDGYVNLKVFNQYETDVNAKQIKLRIL